jgi:hypothetical protein
MTTKTKAGVVHYDYFDAPSRRMAERLFEEKKAQRQDGESFELNEGPAT